jgi:hypothetical protein
MSGGRNSTWMRRRSIQTMDSCARITGFVGAWQEYQGGADETTLGCNTPLDKYDRVVGALQVGRYRKRKE